MNQLWGLTLPKVRTSKNYESLVQTFSTKTLSNGLQKEKTFFIFFSSLSVVLLVEEVLLKEKGEVMDLIIPQTDYFYPSIFSLTTILLLPAGNIKHLINH